MCLFPFLFFLLPIFFSSFRNNPWHFFLLHSTLFAGILLLSFDAIMPGDERHIEKEKRTSQTTVSLV